MHRAEGATGASRIIPALAEYANHYNNAYLSAHIRVHVAAEFL